MGKYNEQIHWNISGAFSKFKEISLFALKNNFLRSYKRVTVYDGIENCVWNGGRLHNGVTYDPAVHNFYKSHGWGINLTFTNGIINDVKDEKGNWLLETFHEDGNSIILYNEDLREHIRKNYPKFKLIYSITGTKNTIFPFRRKDIDFYKDIATRYDWIVPRSDHNFDPGLRELDKSQIELLINEECVFNCPEYTNHFDDVNLRNSQDTSNGTAEEIVQMHECRLDCSMLEIKAAADRIKLGDKYPFNLKPNQVINLINEGYTNFKLRGRDEDKGSFNFFLNEYVIDYDAYAEENGLCLKS